MKFLIKLVLVCLVFCVPYYGALTMKNPYPLMLTAWIGLVLAIWLWNYRSRRKYEKWRREWRHLQEMQYRRY